MHAVLDACHMVKLARNTLGDYGAFRNVTWGIISWGNIRNLCKMQEEEGLSLANEINVNHILWQRHKMKVKLAVQTLSSSAANAL